MEQFYQTWYIYYLQSERKKERKKKLWEEDTFGVPRDEGRKG